MRFSVIVLFAASLVSAVPATKRHDYDTFPTCSNECFAKVSSLCVPDDIECFCVDPSFYPPVFECVKSCCSKEDAKKTRKIAINGCKDIVGIDPRHPFPKCGVSCVKDTPSSKCDGGNQGDDRCYCTDNEYLQNVKSCTQQSCQGDDFDKAKTVGEARCRAVGVDISSI